MERESIVFYRSFYEAIAQLQDTKTKVEVYDAVFEYGLNGVETELTGIAGALFTAFKPQIDKNNKRYENSLKGGAPKGNQNAKKQPKTTEKQPKNNQKQPKTTEKQPKNNQKQPKTTEKQPKNNQKQPKTTETELKETYGTGGNVKLTIAEYERLVTDYGADKTNKAIELLDGYIADKGYKSKDNNRALRRWVFDAVEEKEQKRAKAPTNKFNSMMQNSYTHDEMSELERRLLDN